MPKTIGSVAQYFSALRSVWQIASGLMRRYPVLWLPFLVIGLSDVMVLALACLAPRQPFDALLAPPIRAFWGDRFLHYPSNFFILPKLYEYGHTLVMAGVGVVMTGAAIGMAEQANRGQQPRFLSNVVRAIKRYVTLFWVWTAGFFLSTLLIKGARFMVFAAYDTTLRTMLPPRAMVLDVVLWCSVFAAIAIEALWVYALPIAVLEGQGWWRSLRASFRSAIEFFGPTYLLVLVPSSLLFSVMILKQQIGTLMRFVTPEVTVWVLVFGVVYSLVAEWAITMSATVLYLMRKEPTRCS